MSKVEISESPWRSPWLDFPIVLESNPYYVNTNTLSPPLTRLNSLPLPQFNLSSSLVLAVVMTFPSGCSSPSFSCFQSLKSLMGNNHVPFCRLYPFPKLQSTLLDTRPFPVWASLTVSATYSATTLLLLSRSSPNLLLFSEHEASSMSPHLCKNGFFYLEDPNPTSCLVGLYGSIGLHSPSPWSFQDSCQQTDTPPTLTLLDHSIQYPESLPWTCCPYLWDSDYLSLTP